ncbi:MAG TPA: hypothetical protein VH988_25640 [Thermoanaerobaculia bacterium]|jgi:hypothetical protein|nr:hypothetical protein [Thermoanaerobaculia bacterium]
MDRKRRTSPTRLALAVLLLGILLALPAAAQIQYFGYDGGASDDPSLNLTKAFTNFAYIGAQSDLTSTFVLDRVNAMSQKGLKGVIDLSVVLWCDYDGDESYRHLCVDWAQRWATWKQNNAGILTSDKVLAFAILDEPFNRNAVMTDYETATQRVKADFPWAKTLMIEGACVIAGTCSPYYGGPGISWYQGSLPGIDWLGLDDYGIHPATDQAYQNARAFLKSRFPGRKWVYVMDGYWDSEHQEKLNDSRISLMGPIADEWYNVARNDTDAILLGVFTWPLHDGWTTSQQFSCDIIAHHTAIGRTITQKALPPAEAPGSFAIYNNSGNTGSLSGWVCDPDGTLCQVDLYLDGGYYTTVSSPWYRIATTWCKSGVAVSFSLNVPSGTSGHRFTAVAQDLDFGNATLPSTCAESPACVWYAQSYSPKGSLDNVDATGYATGWVCDQDAPLTQSQVRIAAGSTTVGFYTTNLSNEAAVVMQCGGGSLHRFGVQLPTWTRGLQITAYAENLPYPSFEIKIPVLCANGSCVWH